MILATFSNVVAKVTSFDCGGSVRVCLRCLVGFQAERPNMGTVSAVQPGFQPGAARNDRPSTRRPSPSAVTITASPSRGAMPVIPGCPQMRDQTRLSEPEKSRTSPTIAAICSALPAASAGGGSSGAKGSGSLSKPMRRFQAAAVAARQARSTGAARAANRAPILRACCRPRSERLRWVAHLSMSKFAGSECR